MKKIALITGAASGIGAAISASLQSDIDILILADKDFNKLSNFKNTLKINHPENIKLYHVDLSDINSTTDFIEKLKSENIYPNILINNAGFGGDFQTIDQVSVETWDQVFNINIKSHFLFAKAFLPEMKKNRYGKIITIASIQGFLGAPCSSAYVASKHAAIGLMRTIAVEWGSYGITCNAISPGYVNTKMGIQENQISDHQQKIISHTPLKRIAEPHEIAGLVKYLISSDANFINGENIVIDGGLTCHAGTQ